MTAQSQEIEVLDNVEAVLKDVQEKIRGKGLDLFHRQRLIHNDFHIIEELLMIALDIDDKTLFTQPDYELDEDDKTHEYVKLLRHFEYDKKFVTSFGEIIASFRSDKELKENIGRWIFDLTQIIYHDDTDSLTKTYKSWKIYVKKLTTRYPNSHIFLYRLSLLGLEEIPIMYLLVPWNSYRRRSIKGFVDMTLSILK